MSQLLKKWIGSNQVDETKIRLSNNAALRARNAADSGDINILSVNTSDRILFASVPQVAADASAGNDLVRFSQFSASINGLKPKAAVVAATTGNINLALAVDPNPIDGHTLANGDRVLLWQQTLDVQNGIYDAVTATDPTTWVRSADFDLPAQIPGAYTVAEFGSLYQGKLFVCLSSPGTVGTDPIDFAISTSTTGANQALSNLASVAINTDLIFDEGGPAAVKTKDDAAATQDLSIESGSATADNFNSGALNLLSGNVTGTGISGNIALTSGTSVDGVSGDVNIASGATSGGGNSGNIAIFTGTASSGSDISGNLVLASGLGGGSGTVALVSGDTAGAANTGTVLVSSGSLGGNGGLSSGNVTIASGGATGAPGGSVSGDVILMPGSGAATRGKIAFLDGSEGTAGWVWTSSDTSGHGAWVAPAAQPTNNKELFTLSGTDITNQYLDLAHVAKTNSIDFLVKGGGVQIEGASYDYSVSYTGGSGGNTRITFLNDLATGGPSALVAADVVVVKYQY